MINDVTHLTNITAACVLTGRCWTQFTAW